MKILPPGVQPQFSILAKQTADDRIVNNIFIVNNIHQDFHRVQAGSPTLIRSIQKSNILSDGHQKACRSHTQNMLNSIYLIVVLMPILEDLGDHASRAWRCSHRYIDSLLKPKILIHKLCHPKSAIFFLFQPLRHT